MNESRKPYRANMASLVLLAAVAALAPLGGTHELRARPNRKGEQLLPPPPAPPRPPPPTHREMALPAEERRERARAWTRKHGRPDDIARLDAAVAKRERRYERDLRNLAAGSRLQLATPRNSKEP